MINLPTPTPDRGFTFVSWWIGELWYWSFGWQYFSFSCSTLATSLCSYVGYFLLCGLTQQHIYLHKCPHNAAPLNWLSSCPASKWTIKVILLFSCWSVLNFNAHKSFPTFHSPRWVLYHMPCLQRKSIRREFDLLRKEAVKIYKEWIAVYLYYKLKFPYYAARIEGYPYAVPCTLQSVAYTYLATC